MNRSRMKVDPKFTTRDNVIKEPVRQLTGQ